MPLGPGVRPTAVQKQAPRGLFFCSVPDNHIVHIQPKNGRTPVAVFPNCIVLPPDLHAELVRRSITYWHPMQDRFPLKGIPWIVNACADADEYQSGLEMLAKATAGTRLPVFNRPEVVLETARDKIIEKVSGIDGLTVPNCLKFEPKLPKDFQDAFEQGGFTYPVLVRPAASQTGQGLIKIDGPQDWDKIYTIHWAGRSLYMTQFVERRDEHGTYTKFRVAFINRKPYFKSAVTKSEPIVHGSMRTIESATKEIEMLDRLAEDPALARIIEKLAQVIRLNFWGVDLGWSAEGDFVFFEATAAMSIAATTHTPDEVMKVFGRIAFPIFENLGKAILTPSSWDCWPEANVPKVSVRRA